MQVLWGWHAVCLVAAVYVLIAGPTACEATSSDDNDIVLTSRLNSCQELPGVDIIDEDCFKSIDLRFTIKNTKRDGTSYHLIDSVYDSDLGGDVKLYRPLIVRLRQQGPAILYPITYLTGVNAGPFEIVVPIGNSSESRERDCGGSGTTIAACIQPNEPDHPENAQGFCCGCDGPDDTEYIRGGQDCSVDPNFVTAHCFKYHPLWYSVNSLEKPQVTHYVTVDVFVQKEVGGRQRWIKLTADDDPIILGTKRSTYGSSESWITGKYEVAQQPDQDEPLDWASHRLLIPEPLPTDTHVHVEDVPEIYGGAPEYLVVPASMLNTAGTECNKIGTTYPAFLHQQDACHQPAQSCLNGQPRHLWAHDEAFRVQNQTGQFSLSSFGRLSDPGLVMAPLNDGRQHPAASFDLDSSYISNITLNITIDNRLVLLHGTGLIEDVTVMSVTEEEADVSVVIRNTGLTSSRFHVHLTSCAETMGGAHVIGPSLSHVYNIHVHLKDSLDNSTDGTSCVVELLDGGRRQLAQRTIQLRANELCSCLSHCSCKCAGNAAADADAGAGADDGTGAGSGAGTGSGAGAGTGAGAGSGETACIPLTRSEYHVAGYPGSPPPPTRLLNRTHEHPPSHQHLTRAHLQPHLESSPLAASSTTMANYSMSQMAQDVVRYVVRDFNELTPDIYILIFGLLLFLGSVKLVLSACSTSIGRTGLCLFECWSITEYYEHNIRHLPVVRMKSGRPVHPVTGGRVRLISAGAAFVLNMFFFFYFPFIPIHWILAKIVHFFSSYTPIKVDEPDSSSSKGSRALLTKLAKKRDDQHDGGGLSRSVGRKSDAELSPSGTRCTETSGQAVILDQFRRRKKSLNSGMNVVKPWQSSENNPCDSPRPLSPPAETSPKPTTVLNPRKQELERLCTPGSLVFCNYRDHNSHLWRSGSQFSLCGHVRKLENVYKFTLGPHLTQLFENINDEAVALVTPLPINPRYFQETFSAESAVDHLSEKPLFACLNILPSS